MPKSPRYLQPHEMPRTDKLIRDTDATISALLDDLATAISAFETEDPTERFDLTSIPSSIAWLAHQHPTVPRHLIRRLYTVGNDLYGAIWDWHEQDWYARHPRTQEAK